MATKHNHGPDFGRKVDGCARCDELKAGTEPIRWAWTETWRPAAEVTSEEIHAHFASDRHNNPSNPNWCGPVCTAFDW
jgi:hypothetical protein